MMAVKKIALGAVGIAALVGMAAPAAAQYPGYGYPGTNTNGNVIGQVLQSVLNPYGSQNGTQQGYGMHHQQAAQQCTNAVQQRLSMQYHAGYANSPYGNSPYGYANQQSNARVLGITRVEQRSRSTMRVRGVATSGMAYGYGGYGNQYGGSYGNPYGGSQYGAYGQAQAQGDLTFRCDIDSRGYVRDIDIDRRR